MLYTSNMIRAARSDDLPALPEIETAAGAAFRDLGMGEIADDEPRASGSTRRKTNG